MCTPTKLSLGHLRVYSTVLLLLSSAIERQLQTFRASTHPSKEVRADMPRVQSHRPPYSPPCNGNTLTVRDPLDDRHVRELLDVDDDSKLSDKAKLEAIPIVFKLDQKEPPWQA